MTLAELNDQERWVLLGLVKLVVHADQEVSEEERQVLRQLQRKIGRDAWNQAVQQARQRFATIADIHSAAQAIDREPAQALIHHWLVELAGSDQIIEKEADVLRWVANTWGGVVVVDDVDEQPEDDEPEEFDSFQMILD